MKSCGGVIVRPSRFQPTTSTDCMPELATKLLPAPSDRTAPTGTPETTTDVIVSSASVSAGAILSPIAVSSLPEAGNTFTVGASETGRMVTVSVFGALLVGAAVPSCAVATTVRLTVPSKLATGTKARPAI